MSDFSRTNYYIPAVRPIYERLNILAETVLRVVTGILLVAHGFPKITDPMAMAGWVESLGFYPGVLWSPLLAATEFFGGLLLIAGFLTRPAALAAAIVLITTVWVHWVPMGEGFSGAEFSILWSAVLLFFVIRGGNAHSVDARIGRQF